MTWFQQRVARMQAEQAAPRGSQTLFHEICRLNLETLEYRERIVSLLGIARHIAGIEGLPQTLIRLATSTDQGTAAATFLDAPNSFKQPVILLDSGFFRGVAEADVFVGMVLHELGHIKFTRRFYREAGQLGGFKRFLCNLIEDYRIERLMAEGSLAWKAYLERTRLRLVEQDALAKGLSEWDSLSELNRVTLLISLLLFMPEVLAARAELRAWRLTDGTCVFAELESIFAHEPLEEDDVFRAVEAILARFSVCRAAELQSSLEDLLRELSRPLLIGSGWSWLKLAESMVERSQVTSPYFQGMVESIEQDLLAAANHQERPEPDDPSWQFNDAKRPSGIPFQEMQLEESPESRQRYELIAQECQEISESLRQLFADPVPGAGGRVSGMISGQIDPRRLYRHDFDGRLFQQPTLRRKKLVPTTVGLLLDGSGSMEGQPEQLALQMGVILCESFRKSKNVTVQIYSHLGLLEHGELRYLGDKQDAAWRLGGYRAERASNYDDLAIELVAEKLERIAAEQRVLFVLSDARPVFRNRETDRSIFAVGLTKKAVERLRERGWRVIGLTVGEGAGNHIYGSDRLHFRTLQDIRTKFAPLLLELFQPAG